MHLIDPFNVDPFTADREAAIELLKALPIPILIDVIEEVSGRFSSARYIDHDHRERLLLGDSVREATKSLQRLYLSACARHTCETYNAVVKDIMRVGRVAVMTAEEGGKRT